MAIHQCVHTLSYGDAISGEVLSLERCLRGMGITSEIFALHVHPKLQGRASSIEAWNAAEDDSLVLHYSLGSPLNELYRSARVAEKILVFHNLTPAEWFRGVNPRIVDNIEVGRQELPELLECSSRIFADSRFNQSEIAALGYTSELLELPVDPDRWSDDSNPGIAQMLQVDAGVHLLHVGRLAPNKCIEDIIRVFAYIYEAIDQNVTLWLVGIDTDTELYSFGLKDFAHELGLSDRVKFVGCMADSELRALYEGCSVYVCMSEHEGFCVPLVEAMHFGLPVVAYGATAVPDTVGDGGVILSSKAVDLVGELVYAVATNGAVRDPLIAAGRKRASDFSFEVFQARVQELFASGRAELRAPNIEPRRKEAL